MLRKRGIIWPRVESDDGYTVQPGGLRDPVVYTDGGRSLRIGAEFYTTRVICLYTKTPNWDPPYEAQKPSEREWEKILARVIGALEFLGLEIRFEEPGVPPW